MELFTAQNLTFTYPGAKAPALKDISLGVKPGEFLLVCGPSGGGKTTLLRLLKPQLRPFGELSGQLLFGGRDLASVPDRESVSAIGFVQQDPEAQIVTDKVWHELAYGLENIGARQEEIRLRVGEMASYFGITDWYERTTDSLSGGQKQLLNLAAVLAMDPKVLLLDEPTSQLDPIAASNFFQTLKKLNLELGLTIVLSEHRLEEVFPLADRVAILADGQIRALDEPVRVCEQIRGEELALGFPVAARLWERLGAEATGSPCPLTVRDGRRFLTERFPEKEQEKPLHSDKEKDKKGEKIQPALELDRVCFRYERETPDAVHNATLEVREGEICAVLGANAAGKSTMLQIMAGNLKPYRGKVRLFGKDLTSLRGTDLHRNMLSMLPQNPGLVFLDETVRADWKKMASVSGFSDAETQMEQLAARLGVSHLMDRNPFDLSGGEMQRCALGKILLSRPRLLLLDEPTKGMDAYAKRNFGLLLRDLQKSGVSIILVTHDVEFAAVWADRAALCFRGEILTVDPPEPFFGGSCFYTTAVSRMSRDLACHSVTLEGLLAKAGEVRHG